MELTKNRLSIFLLFALILSTSIFKSESFLFIRIFSLILLSALSFMLLFGMKKSDNLSNLLILFMLMFLVSFAVNYMTSVSKYNERLYFSEYSGYFAIMCIVSLMKNRDELIKGLPYIVAVSSMIQVFYSIPQLLTGVYRINGNSGYANFMGFHLMLGVFSTVYIARKSFELKQNLKAVLSLCATCILIFASFRTGSRNIIILFPLSICIALIGVSRKYLIAAVLFVIFLLLIIPSAPSSRMKNEAQINPYGVQRANIYRQVIKIIENNWTVGIGRNSLPLYSLETNFPVEGRIARYNFHAEIAHNEYLEWIVGQGILGMAMLIFIMINILIYLKIKNDNYKHYVIGMMLMFAVYSLIDNSLYLPFNAVIFFVLLSYILFMNSSNIKIKLPLRLSIVILFNILAMLMILSDIYVAVYSKKINIEITRENVNKSKNTVEYLSKLLSDVYLCETLSNNPYYFKTASDIHEMIYQRSGYVSELYAAFCALDMYKNSDKRNHKVYVEISRLHLKYKNTELRKNRNNDSIIGINYEEAIKLNPMNPFLRNEYADYLTTTGAINYALKQMRIALTYEKNYLDGYKFIMKNDLNSDTVELTAEVDRIMKIKENVKKTTEYERFLLQE